MLDMKKWLQVGLVAFVGILMLSVSIRSDNGKRQDKEASDMEENPDEELLNDIVWKISEEYPIVAKGENITFLIKPNEFFLQTEDIGAFESTISEPLYSRYQIHEVNRTIGDELSYYQACSFVAYLVETYGFDTVVKSYMNVEEMKESYGKSYEELKNDWIEWLEG